MLACSSVWRSHHGVEIEWEFRSLEAFGDQPLADATAGFDLAVIDHPFCGEAESTGSLHALDDILDPATLVALEADAVGPSHTSYTFHGKQWALATDAACQVSALREDAVRWDARPGTWDEALELARSLAGRVALPLAPAHAISSFLSICGALGSTPCGANGLVDQDVGLAALELLGELYALGPREASRWEPPDVLARLTSGDGLAYVPLTYGYVTYARADSVPRPCRFVDAPGGRGAVLGGAGLAVCATARDRAAAAAFAAWASGADAQRAVVAPAGGQPASRAAWLDPELDAQAGRFYSGTFRTIESAWVRPRGPWWPPFQLAAGRLLTEALERGSPPPATLDRLEGLHGELRGRSLS